MFVDKLEGYVIRTGGVTDKRNWLVSYIYLYLPVVSLVNRVFLEIKG